MCYIVFDLNLILKKMSSAFKEPVFSTPKSRESYLLYFGRDEPVYPMADYPARSYNDREPETWVPNREPTRNTSNNRDRSRSRTSKSRSSRNKRRQHRSEQNGISDRSFGNSSRRSGELCFKFDIFVKKYRFRSYFV